MSHSITLDYMPQINEQDLGTAKEFSQYVVGTGIVGMAMRLLWKILNKAGSGADADKKKSQAEETLWTRLQTQIELLQRSEIEMERRIEVLRNEVNELRAENARLRIENDFLMHKADEQFTIIANEQFKIIAKMEQMLNDVQITGKHEDRQCQLTKRA
jgi:regulator of replication initiation timing